MKTENSSCLDVNHWAYLCNWSLYTTCGDLQGKLGTATIVSVSSRHIRQLTLHGNWQWVDNWTDGSWVAVGDIYTSDATTWPFSKTPHSRRPWEPWGYGFPLEFPWAWCIPFVFACTYLTRRTTFGFDGFFFPQACTSERVQTLGSCLLNNN